MWSNPRDIALVFLSLEAFFMALIPLALVALLAYGVYRLRLLAREYLRLAFVYAEQGRLAVERLCRQITAPFFKVYGAARMVQKILQELSNSIVRRSA